MTLYKSFLPFLTFSVNKYNLKCIAAQLLLVYTECAKEYIELLGCYLLVYCGVNYHK